MIRAVVGATCALISVGLAITGMPTLFPTSSAPSSSVAPIGPAVSGNLLTYSGDGPTELSLQWTPEKPPCLNYVIEYSPNGSAGPWTPVSGNTEIISDSSYAYALTPGVTTWWHVVYLRGTFHPRTECAHYVQENVSTVLQFTQPAGPALVSVPLNATAVRFSWSNNASYGGHVIFGSYQLMESVNGGAAVRAALITNFSNRSAVANGLAPGTSYSFYVNMTDLCAGCPGGTYPSASTSNILSFGPLLPLKAVASASRVRADVAQPVPFTCQATGGALGFGYSYAWSFGDGSVAAGQSPTHPYTSAGRFTAGCIATDLAGATATSSVSVTISPELQLGAPSILPGAPELGQVVHFAIIAGGGTGTYQIGWSGLPPGCANPDVPFFACIPYSAGTFNVTATVSDSNGYTVPSGALKFSVEPDPSISSFAAASSNISLGQRLSLSVVEVAGTAPLAYKYTGLPPGCQTTNTPNFSCVPARPGRFVVEVTVTDSVGMQGNATVPVVVRDSGLATRAWFPAVESSAIILATGITALALFVTRSKVARRRSEPTPGESDATPVSTDPAVPTGPEGEPASENIAPPLETNETTPAPPHSEPQVISDVRRLLESGDDRRAVLWAFESVLAELSARSQTPAPPQATYRDRLAIGGGGAGGQLPDLLKRLYRLYEPVRYGQEAAPDTRELVRLLTMIYDLPPFSI
ncbi:MAG: PKD domain-containing protein [Thermoplasmata archaeon]|nr:PKD domain-containing protein [Thermoplasmata archaeon]